MWKFSTPIGVRLRTKFFWVPSSKYVLVATKIEKTFKVNPYSNVKLPK